MVLDDRSSVSKTAPVCSRAPQRHVPTDRRRLWPETATRRGFTLIEMIVATFLMAVAVVAALAAFSTATRTSAVAEQLHTAALLAQYRLTETETQAQSLTGGETSGDFAEINHPEYRWNQVVESTEFNNLYRVNLIVEWGNPTSPRQRVFTTYLRNDTNASASANSQNSQDATGQGNAAQNPGGTPGGGNGQ